MSNSESGAEESGRFDEWTHRSVQSDLDEGPREGEDHVEKLEDRAQKPDLLENQRERGPTVAMSKIHVSCLTKKWRIPK